MPKVSVIIPVYRVEKYIERCVNSLFSQTLDDIEFVFVDDCTPDNSIEIIKTVLGLYPKRQNQVFFYYQKENSGLPAARTLGLQHASGDYVIHCDSDDWVDSHLYEIMYNKALLSGADIVMCDEIKEYENSSVIPIFYKYQNNPKEILQNLRYKSFGFFVHNKLIKRSLYADNNILPYPVINMWEDVGLIYRLMYYAKSFEQIDNCYYHYNRSNVSSMTYANYKGALDMIQCLSNLTDFVKSHGNYSDYEDGLKALQYICKLELISTSFADGIKFSYIFPESNHLARRIDQNWFSSHGKIRFWFVVNHMRFLFILLFNLYVRISKFK